MKKILLVWGWTWGHIMPLLAIYNSFKNNREFEFFWIGESASLEEKISRENNIDFYPIKSGKLRRYFSLKTLVEPINILIWIFQSLALIKKLKPDLIFSKWWYVSLPMAIAGKISWVKVFLHESDTIPGLANRLVGKFASRIFLGFESASRYFNPKKCETIGQLLNPDLVENLSNQKLQKNKKTNLLVVAGSQWSTRIFEFLLKNMDKLEDFDITIVLGSLNTSFKNKFEKFKNITTYDFINHNQIKNLYYNADIAITRAGATMLAELELFNIKLIIIPLKESANNHQYYNALEYEKKWNILLEENNMNKFWIDKILKYSWYKKEIENNFSISWIDKIKKFL